MDKYYFIYVDSLGYFNQCTNPVFIAKHKDCTAILKEDVKGNISTLLEELNSLNYESNYKNLKDNQNG